MESNNPSGQVFKASPGLGKELDRLWASQGLRPHGRTQRGMETMLAAYFQSQKGR